MICWQIFIIFIPISFNAVFWGSRAFLATFPAADGVVEVAVDVVGGNVLDLDIVAVVVVAAAARGAARHSMVHVW